MWVYICISILFFQLLSALLSLLIHFLIFVLFLFACFRSITPCCWCFSRLFFIHITYSCNGVRNTGPIHRSFSRYLTCPFFFVLLLRLRHQTTNPVLWFYHFFPESFSFSRQGLLAMGMCTALKPLIKHNMFQFNDVLIAIDFVSFIHSFPFRLLSYSVYFYYYK